MLRRFFTSERALNLGIGIFISSAVAVIITGLTITQTPEPSLGTYISPHVVMNRAVSTHPSVFIGDSITVFGTRCINKEGINLLAIRSWSETRVDEPRTAQGETIVFENVDKPSGACEPSLSQPIKMPVAVETGWWKISAISISLTDGEIRFWESEEFEVLGR